MRIKYEKTPAKKCVNIVIIIIATIATYPVETPTDHIAIPVGTIIAHCSPLRPTSVAFTSLPGTVLPTLAEPAASSPGQHFCPPEHAWHGEALFLQAPSTSELN